MVCQVFKWLQVMHIDRLQTELEPDEWTVQEIPGCMQQPNMHDCGVYVLGYIWALVRSNFQDCSQFNDTSSILPIRAWILGASLALQPICHRSSNSRMLSLELLTSYGMRDIIASPTPTQGGTQVDTQVTNEKCPICLDIVGTDTASAPYCPLPCGHLYHEHCLQQSVIERDGNPESGESRCHICKEPFEYEKLEAVTVR